MAHTREAKRSKKCGEVSRNLATHAPTPRVSLRVVLEHQSLSASSSIDDQWGTKNTAAPEFPFITQATPAAALLTLSLPEGETPPKKQPQQQSRRHARANPTTNIHTYEPSPTNERTNERTHPPTEVVVRKQSPKTNYGKWGTENIE